MLPYAAAWGASDTKFTGTRLSAELEVMAFLFSFCINSLGVKIGLLLNLRTAPLLHSASTRVFLGVSATG